MNYCRKCRLSDERFWRKFLSSLKLKLVYARGFLLLHWWITLHSSCGGFGVMENVMHKDLTFFTNCNGSGLNYVLHFSAYFSEIVHTGHKCGLNRPYYTVFHLNFDVLQTLMIYDGTLHIHFWDILLTLH